MLCTLDAIIGKMASILLLAKNNFHYLLLASTLDAISQNKLLWNNEVKSTTYTALRIYVALYSMH